MVKYCPNCGKPNTDEDKFCGECGSLMNPRSVGISKPTQTNLPEISPKTLFLIVLILIIFMVIIMTFSRVTVTIWD